MRRARAAAGLIVVMALFAGCDETADKGTPAEDQGPGEVLRVAKGDQIHILIDVRPERKSLAAFNGAVLEEHLMRRAVLEVLKLPADRPDFAGKDVVTVRMLVMVKDEYNRPQWGSAAEAGRLVLSRKELDGLTPAAVEALGGEALRRRFREVTVTPAILS